MSFLSDAFSLQSVPICDKIFREINHLRSYNHCSLLLYSAQAAAFARWRLYGWSGCGPWDLRPSARGEGNFFFYEGNKNRTDNT